MTAPRTPDGIDELCICHEHNPVCICRTVPPSKTNPGSSLSVAQSNFLVLHAQHLVERWQWHFLETQLRAHAGKHSATIWRDELDDLVSRGLMERGHGFDVRITDAGRSALN